MACFKPKLNSRYLDRGNDHDVVLPIVHTQVQRQVSVDKVNSYAYIRHHFIVNQIGMRLIYTCNSYESQALLDDGLGLSVTKISLALSNVSCLFKELPGVRQLKFILAQSISCFQNADSFWIESMLVMIISVQFPVL